MFQSGDVLFSRMLASACDPFTYSYKINPDGGIYYDGFVCDTGMQTVTDVPEMVFPYGEFVALVTDATPAANIPVVRAAIQFAEPVTFFDLLGKRVPRCRPGTLYFRAPGVFIQTGNVRQDGRLPAEHVVSDWR